MSEIRRFKEEDWFCWAGAEKFSNDSDPFVYDGKIGSVEFITIADRNGISVYISGVEDEYEQNIWSLEKSLSALQAEGELRAFVKAMEKYEYAPDLAYALDHCSEPEFQGFVFEGAY